MKKRILSMLLAIVMVAGMIPFGVLTAFVSDNSASTPGHSASNMNGGLEGQAADVFSALGFDTSVLPEGYDAQTTDNPYGRDKLPGNQVFEIVVANSDGINHAGHDDNTLSASSVVNGSLSGNSVPLKAYTAAAGDFDGDGLEGEIAYWGFDNYSVMWKSYPMHMVMYDGSEGSFGDEKQLADGLIKDYGAVANYTMELYQAEVYNALEAVAGDFDGDGYDEIAVFVPETGNVRVDVYKWMRDDHSKDTDWKDLNKWSIIWSHALAPDPWKANLVSLIASDVNMDGIDDLGISHSNFFERQSMGISAGNGGAVILWGDRNNALQNRYTIDLMPDTLGEMSRISLTVGDINLDGYQELVVTGQPVSEIKREKNGVRSVIVYAYDGAGGLASLYSGNVKPVDGSYSEDTWIGNNGFDDVYNSNTRMTTNAAVVHLKGFDYAHLYLDSCLYEFVEGTLTLKMSLDDEKYDGTNSLSYGTYWLGNQAGAYSEYGAVAVDINGDGYDQLFVSYCHGNSNTAYDYEKYSYSHDIYGGLSGLEGNGDGTVTVTTKKDSYTYSTTAEEKDDTISYPKENPCYAIVAADTDMDTIILEYTGKHYLTYSDPKVLAIIAAAPYFEDVDIISDYDYAWQNTTSWSKTEGSGKGSTVQLDLEAGAYVSQGSKFNEAEVATLFTMEWVQESSEITEYTLTFETSQDEDAVAFFSIPTEHYEYVKYVPDGKGGYETDYYVVSRPFQAVYQVLTLDYYESIRGDYSNLPAIRGEILTSTPGDPSSYPASSSGYDVISKWNDDPAGVSFGNGAITQEITVTKEESESYNLGAALDTTVGGGYDGTFASVMAGVTFSINPSGGWTNYEISGTTISGTVTNMPLEFRDYGYYYDWALFSYAADIGSSKVPVVSYIVNNVSEPPKLPADFQQDVERTTSDKNVLTWTYGGEYSKFIVYRYFDFPVGGGLQQVAEYEAGETPYLMKYDANGNPYKEYYFEDVNLAPYSEYQYSIQVERLNEIPPLSAPSALLVARTKAAVGNPITGINESDGEHDGTLLVYPDRNASLTATVNGPDGEATYDYYSTVQYQWQKKVDGAWVDQINETGKTLTFVSAGKSVEGEYRCRINVLTKADNTGITAYTGSVTLTQSKRTSVIAETYAVDLAGNVKLYAKVANAHTDSGAIPGGYVVFNFVNTTTGYSYSVNVPLGSNGVATAIASNSLPAGAYTVEVTYGGSTIFKISKGECVFLSQVSKGYRLDSPESVLYGDGATVTFSEITLVNGIAVQTPVDAKVVAFPGGETVQTQCDSTFVVEDDDTPELYAQGYPIINTGDTVLKGQKYAIQYSYEAYWIEDPFYHNPSDPFGLGGYIFDGYKYRYYAIFTAETSGIIRKVSGERSSSDPQFELRIEGLTGGTQLEKGSEPGVYYLDAGTAAKRQTFYAEAPDGTYLKHTITVVPRSITLQLPTSVKKQDSNLAMGDITYADLPVVSGSWAPADSDSEGNVIGTIADTSVKPTYTNTAGTAFNKDTKMDICGFYSISAKDDFDNYKITFLPGSLTVIGGNKPVTFGVRSFEGKDVGTLYMVSPDYAYTREDAREDKGITLNQAIGSRIVFTAAPDEGYQIYDWYVNGVAQGITGTGFAFEMQNQNTTIEVQFVPKSDVLTFEATEGGTITASDGSLTSGSIVIPNTYVTFTAQAQEGYHFKEWRYTEFGKGTAYHTAEEYTMSSTFKLLMPATGCSLYAVFERDGYTLTYTDKAGADGLTAWYWGNLSGDSTAQLEKITVRSGDTVPGDTEIVIEARPGFELLESYSFVSVGNQGVADYAQGTYTLVLTENTEVSAYTVQNSFDVTVDFDISKTYTFCEGAQVTLTINGTEYVYDCPEDDTTYSASDIPGGSSVLVSVSYPDYYVFDGWNVNGTVKTSHTYTVSELGEDTVITLKLTEKPVYKVTLADIVGKGSYTVTLPEGAGQEGNVITCHENDALTIQVTPDSGYTVIYWNVTAGNTEGSWETKASSLRYQFPILNDDYTFTPVFSGTTYHTVSWTTLPYYGVTLTPEEGYLATVSGGGEFKFTLAGGESIYSHVVSNGLVFKDKVNAASDYPNVYETVAGRKIYTIRNIATAQEISVSTVAPVNELTVTPVDAQMYIGQSMTFAVSYTGVKPTRFVWSDAGNIVDNGNGTYTYTCQSANNVGESYDLTLKSYYGSTELASVTAKVTILDAVDFIEISTKDLDGSYLIHPITPSGENGKYDFDALVTMRSGATGEDVIWSVWGAQMRDTSIDANGVLTVSNKEYGTNGQLKVIAIYTYENGETVRQEIVINLSTDAYVATEVKNNVHGEIVADVGYIADEEVITVMATPDENHAVAVWYINGTAVAGETSNTLSFTAEEMTHYTVSVEFTHYDPDAMKDSTHHWYECECGDKADMEEHYDTVADHLCDACGYKMNDCADSDSNHFCDICDEELSICADGDNDHLCDICGAILSACKDERDAVSGLIDHKCDICGDIISQCENENEDQNCDHCGEAMHNCEDLDSDHLCDQCGYKLTDHTDDNHNDLCDICTAETNVHTDEDNDHLCDSDICDKQISSCVDDDDDHFCDICGEEISTCTDTDPEDHFCDICGNQLADCADGDGDHLCDVCDRELSTCADGDNDHLCDICSEEISTCTDTDPADHFCDICGAEVTDCTDTDKNHFCDICGVELTTCLDMNRDFQCDICGAISGNIATAIKNAIDEAVETLNETISDGDKANADAIAEAITNLTAFINEAKKIAADADAANKAELVSKIETADATLDTAIKAVQKNLEDAQAALNKAIADGDTALDGKITDLNTALETVKAALEATDAANKTELVGKITEAQTTLQSAIDKVAKDLADAEKELADAIASRDAALGSKISSVSVSLSTAKTALEKADADNKAELIAKIEAVEATLDAAIKAVQKNLDDAKTALEKALADGDKANADALAQAISDLNAAIDAAETAAATADGSLKTELTSKIDNADAALQATIDALSTELDATNEKVDQLETFIIIVCVISGAALCGSGAFVVWFFIDRKKRV